ncbi:DUF4136 domain-containing protein [Ekhidna sp.]|uniref:DUF4136 domain-containing protein n=1 Tax=Ekhidna sp. TaxID=2608089 RepID=UPI003C79A638
MIKFIHSNSLIVALIALASCSVYQDVQVTKDKSVDFSQYETYAWLPEKEHNTDTEYDNDFIRQKTRNYFGHCMAERQLKPDTANPDLLLQVEWLSHARKVEVARANDYPDYNSIDNYNAPTVYLYNGKLSGNPGWKEEYSKPEIVKYAHGGAKLTAIDPKTNQIIWEGLAQGDLYDPTIMYDDLHPSIHKMMKKFPIKIPKE